MRQTFFSLHFEASTARRCERAYHRTIHTSCANLHIFFGYFTEGRFQIWRAISILYKRIALLARRLIVTHNCETYLPALLHSLAVNRKFLAVTWWAWDKQTGETILWRQSRQLLNSDYVSMELAQGLCSTCAVISTASLAAAVVFPKLKISGEAPV